MLPFDFSTSFGLGWIIGWTGYVIYKKYIRKPYIEIVTEDCFDIDARAGVPSSNERQVILNYYADLVVLHKAANISGIGPFFMDILYRYLNSKKDTPPGMVLFRITEEDWTTHIMKHGTDAPRGLFMIVSTK